MKVFCIGPNKTGTLSLHRAFQILGLRSFHDARTLRRVAEALKAGERPGLLEEFDAFSDFPLPCHAELRLLYPDGYFLLNTRPLPAWINSRLVHLLHNRVLKKNSPFMEGNTLSWRRDYETLHREVRASFAGHPRFREIDVSAGDGWEALCGFLNLPVPGKPFPFENTGAQKLRDILAVVEASPERSGDPNGDMK